MSILTTKESEGGNGIKKVEAVSMRTSVNKDGTISDEVSLYTETEEQFICL